MSCPFAPGGGPSRRGLLAGAGGLLASAGVASSRARPRRRLRPAPRRGKSFFGEHQGGIATAQQTNSYFVAFDLVAKTRDEVTAMLRAWTEAAARMTSGETARPLGEDLVHRRAGRRIGARSCAGAPDHHVRFRRRAVREGRRGPLRPGGQTAGGAGRPAQIQRRPTCRPRAPAATSRCRLAPTTRRSRFTRCANWTACPMARRRCAGRRQASCRNAARRNAAQPDGLQGWDHQSSARRRAHDAR